ncbi:hypothetical protein ANN_05102 [Periplaneta americana]|uniref:Uncharacterized protein n=1 Tax=Periplaneta americana TaxID=6978 RepID=A0ABQ8TBY0_PERAM|nr:hypothetical protein ANN_05102 [Periplaneta americana]
MMLSTNIPLKKLSDPHFRGFLQNFSRYKNCLSDRRRRFSFDNLREYIVVYCNAASSLMCHDFTGLDTRLKMDVFTKRNARYFHEHGGVDDSNDGINDQSYLNSIDLDRDPTRNLRHRIPALYRLRHPGRHFELKEQIFEKLFYDALSTA